MRGPSESGGLTKFGSTLRRRVSNCLGSTRSERLPVAAPLLPFPVAVTMNDPGFALSPDAMRPCQVVCAASDQNQTGRPSACPLSSERACDACTVSTITPPGGTALAVVDSVSVIASGVVTCACGQTITATTHARDAR